jgi:2Fe-2S ferredoxin
MHINVTDQRGKRHRLEALEGFRVMEVIRDWGLDIKAECGGAAACATCHVHVARDWIDRLVPPLDEEVDRLDEAFEVDETSRLSCQIIMNDDLDGLEVTLAPGTEKDEIVRAA